MFVNDINGSIRAIQAENLLPLLSVTTQEKMSDRGFRTLHEVSCKTTDGARR